MEEDAALLHKEFPELDLDLVESTLESKGGNLPEARAALVQLTASAESCAAGQNDGGATQRAAPGTNSWNSWLGLSSDAKQTRQWNLGLDDVHSGLSGLGSRLTITLKEAAQLVSHYIPAQLNYFAEGTPPPFHDDQRGSAGEVAGEVSLLSPSSSGTMSARRGNSSGLPSSPTLHRGSSAASDCEGLSPKMTKKCE